MKILMISDAQRRGGAAIAAVRLARALEDQGHTIAWAVGQADVMKPGVYRFTDGPFAWQLAQRLTGTLAPGMQRSFTRLCRQKRIEAIIDAEQPDIVSIHNIHGSDLSPTFPAELSQRKPVVWTLHDMWAFTGTCVYSFGCRQFETGCSALCDQCDHSPRMEARHVPAAFAARRQSLATAGRLAFVTPSRWLAREAQYGLLRNQVVRAIPNSVDVATFHPVPKAAARVALGLPEQGAVVLSASASLTDPRKGTQHLLAAMAMLSRPVTWLTLGEGSATDLPDNVHPAALGSVHDERLLRLAYSAADVHVLPTLADNLPNVLLEAAACGTPTVAFGVGGVPEAVVDGVTGWCVPVGQRQALAHAMYRVLDLPQAAVEQLQSSCRAFAKSQFDPLLQAQRYVQLFEELLTRNQIREAA